MKPYYEHAGITIYHISPASLKALAKRFDAALAASPAPAAPEQWDARAEAEAHLIFEESCATIDPPQLVRLTELLQRAYDAGVASVKPIGASWRLVNELEREIIRLNEELRLWMLEVRLWRGAWLRHLGGYIVRKAHEIDGFGLRHEQQLQEAEKRGRDSVMPITPEMVIQAEALSEGAEEMAVRLNAAQRGEK